MVKNSTRTMQYLAYCFRFRLRTLLGLVFAISIGLAIWHAVTFHKKISDVLHAESSDETSVCYRSLFSSVPLWLLRRSPHESIALQASWEEVARSIPIEKGRQTIITDNEKVIDFFAVLECCGRISIPEWWIEFVSNLRANRRDYIFGCLPTNMSYHETELDFVKAPEGTAIWQDSNGNCHVQIGKDSSLIPTTLFSKSGSGLFIGQVSATFTAKYCFMAEHDDRCRPHSVACIDRTTGKAVWISLACGCNWNVLSSGAEGESKVTIVAKDDRIVVFGVANQFYAHGYRVDNGDTIFRFSSDF